MMLASLLSISSLLSAQNKPAPTNYEDYYEWFNEQSQTTKLYQNNTTLYIFGNAVNVREAPCLESEVLTQLSIGQKVKNIAYPEYYLPEDEINGYGDIWYHVKGKDKHGKTFNGYVWGALIAKSWKAIDIDNDKKEEFLMLGISSKKRSKPTDINAEIRMIKDGIVSFRQTIPGLCLFEDCASSALIRTVKTPGRTGYAIIEASTMTIGCTAGIEKALMVWNGLEFDLVFHNEVLSQTTFVNKEFVYTSTEENQTTPIQLCKFGYEDQSYNPIWICEPIPIQNNPKPAKPKA